MHANKQNCLLTCKKARKPHQPCRCRHSANACRRSIKADWRYWEQQGFLEEDKYGCRTKQEAQIALLKKYGGRYQDPEAFCRPVKVEDFTGHPEYNAGEIMSGFHGEYWGLNGDLNPFDESMHAIARIHSLLPEGMTLQVAKKKLL